MYPRFWESFYSAPVEQPDARQKLGAVGFEIVGSTPKELDEFVRREFAHWDKFVREFDLRFD